MFSISRVPDWSVANSWMQVKSKGFYFKREENCIRSRHLVLQNIRHLTLSTQN